MPRVSDGRLEMVASAWQVGEVSAAEVMSLRDNVGELSLNHGQSLEVIVSSRSPWSTNLSHRKLRGGGGRRGKEGWASEGLPTPPLTLTDTEASPAAPHSSSMPLA